MWFKMLSLERLTKIFKFIILLFKKGNLCFNPAAKDAGNYHLRKMVDVCL